MAEGHTVNGTATSLYADEFSWSGAISAPEYSGDDLSLPYMVGEIAGNRTRKGRYYSVGYSVKGASRGDMLDNARALVALVVNDGALLTLGRTIPTGSGEVTGTAVARYVDGADLDTDAPDFGRMVVRWRLLEGKFSDEPFA